MAMFVHCQTFRKQSAKLKPKPFEIFLEVIFQKDKT